MFYSFLLAGIAGRVGQFLVSFVKFSVSCAWSILIVASYRYLFAKLIKY